MQNFLPWSKLYKGDNMIVEDNQITYTPGFRLLDPGGNGCRFELPVESHKTTTEYQFVLFNMMF